MARNSVYTNVTARRSLAPASRTSTATGASVDRNAGRDMHRTAMVLVSTGTITDGTHTIEVQDSDNGSDFTAVDDAFLQGIEPTIEATDDDGLFFIGYIGVRRYLRVMATVSGAPTTGGIVGAVVLLGEPRRGPVEHTTS